MSLNQKTMKKLKLSKSQKAYIEAQRNLFTTAKGYDRAAKKYRSSISKLQKVEKRLSRDKLIEVQQLIRTK